jgi:hypothetical protein
MNLQELFDIKAKETHYNAYSQNQEQRKKSSETGRNLKYWQGKSRDAETCAKISASLSDKPRPNRVKTMVTPNGVFEGGIGAVAAAAGVTRETVYNWMKKWPNDYYYISKEV